jgi:hypothetical protein
MYYCTNVRTSTMITEYRVLVLPVVLAYDIMFDYLHNMGQPCLWWRVEGRGYYAINSRSIQYARLKVNPEVFRQTLHHVVELKLGKRLKTPCHRM